MKYLKKYTLLLLILLCNRQVFAQYDIKIEISDSKDTALILGHYYLDKTYAIDTAWNKNNTFTFKSKDKKLDSGIYFLSNLNGRFVEIMLQNEEYSIVKTGTSYGIALYDHIALDGSKIQEDELLK